MKTLDRIKNFVKKPIVKTALYLTLGGMVLIGCENKALKKYNEENKQVHKDVISFVHEKGTNFVYNDTLFSFEIGKYFDYNQYKPYTALSIMDMDKKCARSFYDYGQNGLDGKDDFGKVCEGVVIESAEISELNKEKQLELDKEYTETAINIMHNEGHKNY